MVADIAGQDGSPSVHGFGMLMAATGLGFVLGPIVGAAVNPTTAYQLAAAITVLAAAVTHFGYDEKTTTSIITTERSKGGALGGLKLLLSDPDLRDLMLAFELGNGTVGIYFTYLPYMLQRFGNTYMQAGIFLAASGLINALFLWVLIKQIVPKVFWELLTTPNRERKTNNKICIGLDVRTRYPVAAHKVII